MNYKGYTFSVERNSLNIEKKVKGEIRLAIIPLPLLEEYGLKTFDDAIKCFNKIPKAEFV